MTVSRQIPKVIYLGNGLARDWTFPFPVREEEHLKLVVSSPENEITQIPQTEYQVDLSAGSVRYPLEGMEPLSNGWKIAVLRETPIDQGIDLVNNGGMFPQVLEGGLDKLSMIAQEIEVKMARAVMVPETADDPVEYGNLILSGAERAESAAIRAESSAGSAGGNANAARMARDKALEAQGEAESAADRAAVEGVKAFECMIASESSKNQAILEATKAEAAAERAESAASGIGGGTGSVVSVAGKQPDESGNITLAADDVGAAILNHSHTLQDLGAASVSHSHTAQDVGAASTSHNHDGSYSLNGHNHDESYVATIAISAADAGKVLTVKPEGNGFEVTEISSSGGGMNCWESGDYPIVFSTATIVSHGLNIEHPEMCRCDVRVKYVGPSGVIPSYLPGDFAPMANINTGAMFKAEPTLDKNTIKIMSGSLSVLITRKVDGGYYTIVTSAGSAFYIDNFRYVFRIWY